MLAALAARAPTTLDVVLERTGFFAWWPQSLRLQATRLEVRPHALEIPGLTKFSESRSPTWGMWGLFLGVPVTVRSRCLSQCSARPWPRLAAATVQSVGVRVPSSVGPWGPHPGPAPGWRSLLPPGPGRYAAPAGFGADLDPCGAFHC